MTPTEIITTIDNGEISVRCVGDGELGIFEKIHALNRSIIIVIEGGDTEG